MDGVGADMETWDWVTNDRLLLEKVTVDVYMSSNLQTYHLRLDLNYDTIVWKNIL